MNMVELERALNERERQVNVLMARNAELLAACKAMYYSQGPIEEAAAWDMAKAALDKGEK